VLPSIACLIELEHATGLALYISMHSTALQPSGGDLLPRRMTLHHSCSCCCAFQTPYRWPPQRLYPHTSPFKRWQSALVGASERLGAHLSICSQPLSMTFSSLACLFHTKVYQGLVMQKLRAAAARHSCFRKAGDEITVRCCIVLLTLASTKRSHAQPGCLSVNPTWWRCLY
jgi:hypothetical protein